MKMSATGDLVLVNGNVITMDPARPRASAVGIRDGRIVVVGSDAEARAALVDLARRARGTKTAPDR